MNRTSTTKNSTEIGRRSRYILDKEKKTQHKCGLLWSEGITKVQNFFLKSKRFKLQDLNP